ncbi:MFS general substrate transporter [Naviculisporaceae sp. PSN 640]
MEMMPISTGERPGSAPRPGNGSVTVQPQAGRRIQYITGPRFYLIVFAVSMSLFLTNFEIPVVVTSLVPISTSLGHMPLSAWVMSAYLLGYVSFLVIFAKLSDIFGRKAIFFICLLLFTIFSGACAAVKTMKQLIILRAFQGFAGGGCYSVPLVMSLEMVPKEKFAALTAFLSAVMAVSMIAGPVIGGAISNSGGLGWRWAFLLNVPAAVPVLAIILFVIPSGFPYHNLRGSSTQDGNNHGVWNLANLRGIITRSKIKRVDFFGGFVLLLGTLLVVSAFEEAGLGFGWLSPFVVNMLVLSIFVWGLFIWWERRVTFRLIDPGNTTWTTEPVFPFHFFSDRIWLGMSLAALSLGAVWVAGVYQLPQRFQVLHGLSALDAGLRVMAYTGIAPIASIITAAIAKRGVPPIYIILFSAGLQILGFALLGSIPIAEHGTLDDLKRVDVFQYVYQILAGFGCGSNISLLALMTPFSVKEEDLAVALGAITQVRIMGSALGVAIVTSVMHNFLTGSLGQVLRPVQILLVLDRPGVIGMFPQEIQRQVLIRYAEGYNQQMKILAGLAVGQVVGVALMWQHKKQIKV